MAEETFWTGKALEYPWQMPVAPRALAAEMTESERRADFTRRMFELEKSLLDDGTGGQPLLFYDAPKDFFRFSDGRFTLSREYADWPVLKEVGLFSEWGVSAGSSCRGAAPG